MGFLSWFYVSAKAFEPLVVEGCSVPCLVERSCGVTWAILLCKLGVVLLLNLIEELVRRIEVAEFFKSSRDGNKVFIA